MKKIIVCSIVLLVIGGILFSHDNIYQQNKMNSLQALIYNEKSINYGPPLYENKDFLSIDELIEWIETENIETFQDGRYKNTISLLREQGEILIPSFTDVNMPSRIIELSHFRGGSIIFLPSFLFL